jgi:hypothetical protein
MSRWDRGGRANVLTTEDNWPVEEAEERFVMEVVTVSGRAAAVQFRISRAVVEVWHRGRCNATFERDVLGSWLAEPEKPLVVDDVAFSLDRMVDRSGRVALSLPDVLVWTLAPEALAGLRQRL